MNLEQIIINLTKYKTKTIKKLSANHWRPYFLIKENFLKNVLDDEFRRCFCRFYIMNGPNDLPIYDRNIADVLELESQTAGTLEAKIKNRVDIYNELKNNFILLLKDYRIVDFLKNIRKEIYEECTKNNFAWKNSLVSNTKLLDSSLWALYDSLKTPNSTRA